MSDPAPPDDAASEPSPRAFCQATGVVFQVVGAIVVVATCCWGGINLFTETPIKPHDPQRRLVSVVDDSEPYQLWSMAAVCVCFTGGLAAGAIGLGLQHERPRSGRTAMLLAGVVAGFFWCYLVFGVMHPATGRLLVAGGSAAVWTVLFLLAGHSAELLKRFPPPAEAPWTERDEDDLRRAASPRPPDRMNP